MPAPPPNDVQIATAWIAAAAAVISVAALVVAILSWRAARRSAAAAEKNAGVAAREEQRRLADRHAADGPTFDQLAGRLGDRAGKVAFRLVGGPGQGTSSAEIVDPPWCRGFACGDGTWERRAEFGELEPGDTFGAPTPAAATTAAGPQPPPVLVILFRASRDNQLPASARCGSSDVRRLGRG